MMRRRVAEANGTLDIGPAPGGGTLVVAHLPIASRRSLVKVLIVDDHALVRRGLGHVVRDCFPRPRSSRPLAPSALELMPHDVEIALVDVRMPDSTVSSCSTS